MINRKIKKVGSQEQEEILCWQQLKEGDRQALEKLYVKFARNLFQYGMAVRADRSLVKDCIQELFIDLWKYRKSLKDTDNVKVYLSKSLSNKIFRESHLEKRRQSQNPQEIMASLYQSDGPSADGIPEKTDEKIRRLHLAIDRLPLRQKELIHNVYFKKLSSEEVSIKMGIGIQSVYTLTWKAISKLKKSILSLSSWIYFLTISTLN